MSPAAEDIITNAACTRPVNTNDTAGDCSINHICNMNTGTVSESIAISDITSEAVSDFSDLINVSFYE